MYYIMYIMPNILHKFIQQSEMIGYKIQGLAYSLNMVIKLICRYS